MDQRTALQLLRDIVAPDLNLLYTEPPRSRNGGPDCGWFCREHALHVHTVCSAWGLDSDIRNGHFHVSVGKNRFITTLDTDSGHSWCRVGTVVPVDLSMTFQYYGIPSQLHSTVAGLGPNGDYMVHYSTNEDTARSHDESIGQNMIYFIEQDVLKVPVEELLLNPYLFLHPPGPADSQSWDRLHGSDIYAKISLHCWAIAQGESAPLVGKLNMMEAVRWIKATYLNPIDRILQLKAKGAGSADGKLAL